jgi:hypothetical protein
MREQILDEMVAWNLDAHIMGMFTCVLPVDTLLMDDQGATNF